MLAALLAAAPGALTPQRAAAQTPLLPEAQGAPAAAQGAPATQGAPDSAMRITWEVRNRFRLFREERDFLDEESALLGDMARLTMFPDETFDVIVHPVSNCFVPDVRAVWREAYRVLRPGGRLVSGFSNGLVYLFDFDDLDRGVLTVAHSLPYSDLEQLSARELQQRIAACEPLEFGHTLSDQIGGQIDAGFTLCGLYEDTSPGDVLGRHAPLFVATLAVKPAAGDRR